MCNCFAKLLESSCTKTGAEVKKTWQRQPDMSKRATDVARSVRSSTTPGFQRTCANLENGIIPVEPDMSCGQGDYANKLYFYFLMLDIYD